MPDVPLLENDTFDSNHRHDEQMELEHAVHSVSKASPRPEVDAQIATATSPDANAIVDDVNRENDDYDDDDHFIPPSPGAARYLMRLRNNNCRLYIRDFLNVHANILCVCVLASV